MELKNNKILISAIIVVLVVLVSYNFEGLTGKATEGYTRTIKATPSTVKGGFDVTVEVKAISGLINTGGTTDDEDRLWLKGPTKETGYLKGRGVTREIYLTCSPRTSTKCKIAVGKVHTMNNWKGDYELYLRIGAEEKAIRKTITVI